MAIYNVNSEIGKLKKVLLHEPGEEINNLIPEYLSDLLFDDIPWLPLAKQEHRSFADVFREHGVEVVYLTDLLKETLDQDVIYRKEFIDSYVKESGVTSETLSEVIKEYLGDIADTDRLIAKTIGGIKKSDLPNYRLRTLTDMVDANPFITNPIPNLYFQRDPFVTIGDGICLNHMYSSTRRRETLFAKTIFMHHPVYHNDKLFYDRDESAHIEGGDILVLNRKVLIIGVSQRTSSQAIEKLAKHLFYDFDTEYRTILVMYIPNRRAFMHLDTVFTQIDYSRFAIHNECKEIMQIYELTKDEMHPHKLSTRRLDGSIEDIVSAYVGERVELIPCGGYDRISAAREQWSDGANTLAIAPGEVITYNRNNITNDLLRSNGIKVNAIASSELSRGRGGPRCMCMPLEREDID